MNRYERVARRNSRKRCRADDEGTDDRVNGEDDRDDGTGVDGAVEGLEGDKETSGDYDASENSGKAVQTDLTSMCISKLEQNVDLIETKKRYIAAEAEKTHEEMVITGEFFKERSSKVEEGSE